ncbi:hypothetical protein HK100_003811, partial [Physocladia obscura]
MLWNCYDHDLLNEIGNSQAAASCPFASEKKFGLNTALLELLWREDAAYKKMFRKLSGLIDENLVRSLESVEESVAEEPDTVNLNIVLVYNALSAVLTYKSTSASSIHSESHCKIELWAPIFSSAFKINKSRCNSIWEMLHPIPGNGGKGSLLSDYSAVVQGPLAIPAFMVEFEVGRTGACPQRR